jgi:hypothetical protein
MTNHIALARNHQQPEPILRMRDLVIGTLCTVTGVKSLCEVTGFETPHGMAKVRVKFLKPETTDGTCQIGGVYYLALVRRVPDPEPEAA